jgi:hypothetical protein
MVSTKRSRTLVPLLFLLSTLLWFDNPHSLLAAQAKAYNITGTMDLLWLESGFDHFGPHPIRGHLVTREGNRYSAVTVLGRSRPVEDAVMYSTDSTDAFVVSAKRESLDNLLAFAPTNLLGFGFITPGPIPRHYDPAIPVDEIQLVALALRVFSSQVAETSILSDLPILNLSRKSLLLPADGLPRSAHRIKGYTNSASEFTLWSEVLYPGTGTHRENKYEYAYPGPFQDSGYIGHALRISGSRGPQSRILIESTNFIPSQSNDVRGAPYDTLRPSEVYQISLALTEDGETDEPTRMAMRTLKGVDANDHRHSHKNPRATGIHLSSSNAWPSRDSKEFATTSEDSERRISSGRKFKWIFAFALISIAVAWRLSSNSPRQGI